MVEFATRSAEELTNPSSPTLPVQGSMTESTGRVARSREQDLMCPDSVIWASN